MRRAIFEVTVGGADITSALAPIFLSLSITDNAGTHSDTASIEIDDTGGRVILPEPGAPVSIALGWSGDGLRTVFSGTVDEVRSAGSRSAGRTLSIQAKGVDSTGQAKEVQQRHFDQTSVQDILRQAGAPAGITQIAVDPDLAGIVFPYLEVNESFLHLGQRLAREIGGAFKVQGNKATLSKRGKVYAPSISAAWGTNLHSWSMTPAIGRTAHTKGEARTYDLRQARELIRESAETGIPHAAAAFIRRERLADENAAQQAADGDAATSQEEAGGGSVVIEGNTGAIPDGLCILTGARPGIDGTYRIKTVTHSLQRGSGWTTSLDLVQPQGGAGKDTRGSPARAGAPQPPATDGIDPQ